MDYELISGFILITTSFIFMNMATQLKNKILRLFFLLILMISLPLNFAYMTEMVKLHDDGSLTGLINLLTVGFTVTLSVALTVTGYMIVLLISFGLEKINNMARKDARLPEDDLQLEEALE